MPLRRSPALRYCRKAYSIQPTVGVGGLTGTLQVKTVVARPEITFSVPAEVEEVEAGSSVTEIEEAPPPVVRIPPAVVEPIPHMQALVA